MDVVMQKRNASNTRKNSFYYYFKVFFPLGMRINVRNNNRIGYKYMVSEGQTLEPPPAQEHGAPSFPFLAETWLHTSSMGDKEIVEQVMYYKDKT